MSRRDCKISDWVDTVPDRCMWCGCGWKWPGLQVHHIERRSASISKKRDCGYNLLKLCEQCHSGVFDTLPHVIQLRVKMERDFDSFDLKAWLAIAGRPDSYVTQEEIDAVELPVIEDATGLRF